MGILELTLGAVVAGFFTVFGWNYGNIVWDKYVEPPAVEQPAAQNEHDKK
jgi:hypothetical protein